MLEFKFDTQLLIEGHDLDEDAINDYFTNNFKGDCLLAVGDDELIKIHYHTNDLRCGCGKHGAAGAGAEGLKHLQNADSRENMQRVFSFFCTCIVFPLYFDCFLATR